MSYYDYDHFWAPHEVCGQKSKTIETQKLSSRIKQFLAQTWDEVFLRKSWDSDSIDSSTIQDKIR